MLRRRPAGNGGGAQFKPFVLPVKGKPARVKPEDDDEDAYEDEDAANNRQALRSGASLSVKRLPFLSFLVMEPERRAQHVRRPFKSPCGEGGRTQESNRLLQVKTLGMRRRWGSVVLKPMVRHDLPPVEVDVEELEIPGEPEMPVPEEPAPVAAPAVDAPPPLVLWQSETDPDVKVVVPEIVGKFLRPHQREGVQFMFDCVCQIRGFDGQGCILADDMGLGKTLQSITLMYTLFMTGMDMQPTVKRAIVVCPTSLVKNWDDEIIKWLHGRVKTIALYEAKRETVIKGINQFIEGSKRPRPGFSAQVLVISYETFRMHAQKFADTPACCELLICDEAHRLKNASSQINKALSSLPCRKRVLLSGTPMQNDLEEFFAMVDFTNPNILGTPSEFRKNYLGPILVGREPDSTDRERGVAQSCSAMLCEIVNQFILRRGNILNAKHLPPKLMQVICCPLSPLQEQLYMHFLSSSACRDMMKRKSANVLSSITALKKLCNHPLLIFDEMGQTNTKLPGFGDCAQYFAVAKESRSGGGDGGGHRRGGFGARTCYPEWSGKMLLLDRLMSSMRSTTTDRIVIVSNYTQTLDVVSSLCQERHLPYVRLDGTTSAKKRKKLVDTFNDPTTNSFAFLLSSKAGGCGLNLIGANRLVLFDPDWNPATDKQAAARVWREGQKKMCYVYRFLATGTLEEKIFQRQLSKEGLQNIVDDKEEVNSLSSKDLKRLFVFRKDTMSDTHDQLKCDRCQWRSAEANGGDMSPSVITIDDDLSENETGNETSPEKGTSSDEDTDKDKGYHPQIGMPPEEDLNSWGHHRSYASVDDEVMQSALQQVQNDLVSFAFSCRIDWELLQEHQAENEEKENQRDEERKRKRMELVEAANKRRADEQDKKSKPSKVKKSKDVGSDESEAEYSSSSDEEKHEVLGESESESEGEDEFQSSSRRNSVTSEIDISCTPKPPIRRPSPATTSLEASSHPVQGEISEAHLPSPSSMKRRVSFALEVNSLHEGSHSPKKQRISEMTDSDEDDAFVEDVLSDRRSARAPPKGHLDEKGTEDTGKDAPQVWSCSRCTLINPTTNPTCSGCGLRYRRSRPEIIDLGDDDDEDECRYQIPVSRIRHIQLDGEIVVGTRLHWHSHSQRDRIDVEKVLDQVRAFCTRAATYSDGGILIAVGLPEALAGSFALSSDESSSLSSAFIHSVRDFMSRLQSEVADGTLPGKVEIIPMLHWGTFVPALNALIGTAADHFPKADTLILQSLEIVVDAASVASLRSHFDIKHDLVVGAALPGHHFQPDLASQPVELTGLTSPWNTLAVWNLEQLTKVGFALMGDALRLEVDGIGSAAGIEEVATIAMYQQLYANSNSSSPTTAKLVRVPSIAWQVDGLEDPKRLEWHQKKMASKLQRAAAQITRFGVPPGRVHHLEA